MRIKGGQVKSREQGEGGGVCHHSSSHLWCGTPPLGPQLGPLCQANRQSQVFRFLQKNRMVEGRMFERAGIITEKALMNNGCINDNHLLYTGFQLTQ